MHVRTRLKLFQRAKMWPTTYTVRLASPALRDLERFPPRYAGADPGVHLDGSAAEPALGRQTLERELDHGAHRGGYRVIYEFQKEDQRVLVRVDQRPRLPAAVKGRTASPHLDSMLTDLIVTFAAHPGTAPTVAFGSKWRGSESAMWRLRRSHSLIGLRDGTAPPGPARPRRGAAGPETGNRYVGPCLGGRRSSVLALSRWTSPYTLVRCLISTRRRLGAPPSTMSPWRFTVVADMPRASVAICRPLISSSRLSQTNSTRAHHTASSAIPGAVCPEIRLTNYTQFRRRARLSAHMAPLYVKTLLGAGFYGQARGGGVSGCSAPSWRVRR